LCVIFCYGSLFVVKQRTISRRLVILKLDASLATEKCDSSAQDEKNIFK